MLLKQTKTSRDGEVLQMVAPSPAQMSNRAKARRLGGKRPSRFWQILDDIPRPLRLTLNAASLLLPLAAWAIASGMELVNPIFLPGPLETFAAGRELVESGQLATDAVVSVRRVGIGFGLAMLVAIPLGLGMGTFKSVNALFEPAIAFVRYMPATAFIALLLIWLGLGEAPKVALIFLGVLFFNTLMTANIVWQVPTELVRVAYTLGASNLTVFRKVIFPYAVPGMIDAARVNLAAAWNLIIVAELFAAEDGLGVRIARSQRFLDTDRIFAILIVIGVLGLTTDLLLRTLRNRVAPWSQE